MPAFRPGPASRGQARIGIGVMGLGREIGPLIGISASTELRVTDLPVEQITYAISTPSALRHPHRAFPRSAAKSVLG